MGAAPGFARPFRRTLTTVAVAALAAAGLVGITTAPAGADETFGYTIEVQVPQGLGGDTFPCRLAKVDLATGAVTGIGSFLPPESLACANDLAFSPSGVLYGIVQGVEEEDEIEEPPIDDSGGFGATAVEFNEEVHLVRFDTATGAVTDLGVIGGGPAFIGNLESPGNLWVLMVGQEDECDNDAFCLYQVDPNSPGTATFEGKGPGETFLFGLTANCAGAVYTTEQIEPEDPGDESDVAVAIGGNVLMSVNTTAGTMTEVGAGLGGNHFVQSMDFSTDGVLHAIGSEFESERSPLQPGFLYTVNPTAGTATQGAQLSAPQFRFAMSLAVAPLSCAPAPLPVPSPNFTG